MPSESLQLTPTFRAQFRLLHLSAHVSWAVGAVMRLGYGWPVEQFLQLALENQLREGHGAAVQDKSLLIAGSE
jgi:hypothetical protein